MALRSGVLAVIALSLAAVHCTRAGQDPPGSQDRACILTHAGRERVYHLHLPPDHTPERRWPLLLVLHGGGGTGAGFDRSMTGGTLNRAAEARGFIVAYPEAHEKHWNDGRGLEAYASQKLGIDDVGFLVAVLDEILKTRGADPRRVYVAGLSNGGLMTYRMLQEHPERFAAGASFVANLPRKREGFRPRAPVPLMVVNGTEDPLMPFGGGEAYSGFGRRRNFLGDFLSTEETCAAWARWNACEGESRDETLPDADPGDGTRIRRKVWTGPRAAEMVLYVVEGGGHAWPGGNAYLGERLIGRVSRELDATEVLFAFLSRHPGSS